MHPWFRDASSFPEALFGEPNVTIWRARAPGRRVCVAMASRRVRPRGVVSDFADVVSKVAGDYVKDRRLCFSLALGATWVLRWAAAWATLMG